MKPTQLQLLLEGVGQTAQPGRLIRGISTDSREMRDGSLFVALSGERFDGNDYVGEAFRGGASAAVVERKAKDAAGEQILVENTRDALLRMAKNYRAQFDLTVAGVTGSVGKTTTKEMIAAVFGAFGSTLKNEGNLNNEIGLSKTVFQIEEHTRLGVFEMGMDRPGDIKKLSDAVRPAAAVITAIGMSHIEYFGTKENILAGKMEITEGMPADGLLVLNGDDPLLMRERGALRRRTASFAIRNTDADVVGENLMTRPDSSEFTVADRENGRFLAKIPAVGDHNVMNALAAYTLAVGIGLDPRRSAEALWNYRPVGMRQRIVPFRGITVIEDCYNANPDSMRAALSALSALPAKGIRVAVFGDMLELGAFAEPLHRALGVEAAAAGVDMLLCCGEHTRVTAEAAEAANITSVRHFDDKEELAAELVRSLRAGDAVVFKASRGMRMEEVLARFYAGFSRDGPDT